MPTSNIKRAVNILIFIALFVFLHQISGMASDHMDRASGAIAHIQGGGR